MTQVSRRFLKNETVQKIDQLFCEAISRCNNDEVTKSFLSDFFTSTEKVMFSKRLAIGYLLLKGYPTEIINNTLKVSNPTIRYVAGILQYRGTGLKKILDQMIKNQNWKRFFEELADVAIEIVGTGKGANWKQTKSYLYHQKLKRQQPI